MFIFILFERAGILFESAFSLWVYLKVFFYFFKKHSALRNPICGSRSIKLYGMGPIF